MYFVVVLLLVVGDSCRHHRNARDRATINFLSLSLFWISPATSTTKQNERPIQYKRENEDDDETATAKKKKKNTTIKFDEVFHYSVSLPCLVQNRNFIFGSDWMDVAIVVMVVVAAAATILLVAVPKKKQGLQHKDN